MDPTKLQVKHTKLFINNEFVDAMNKKTFPVINPSTGKMIVEVAEADKADVDRAVQAARMAFARGSEWRMMTATQRGQLMHKLADLMERDMEELAMLESLDNGKTVENSMTDVRGSIKVMRYYAGWADKIHGDTIPVDGPFMGMTRQEPIGVVGQIIPWNYPLMMLAWKWAPALATGCTVILKPAEQTPLTALLMAALSKEVGFPKGVINVLPGFGTTAGEAITRHPEIRKVAFTGSTEVGHKVMEAAAQSNLKRVSLELGGKSPLVIMDDVDLDEAVALAHFAAFMNHGQNCCAGSRTFVHAKIYDQFVKKAAEKAKTLRVGDPFKSGIQQGPQIDKDSLDKIMRLVEMGKKEGAKLMAGGKRMGTEGFFFEPTVFADVTDNMTIANEEIFGPVQTILKFETMEEVIERANKTQYGLAAGIMTKDMDRAMMFSNGVEAGSIWVNTFLAIMPQMPFGGYKLSGMGRDLGREALDEYLETKSVTVKMPKEMMSGMMHGMMHKMM